jgi:plasmid stability protein
MAVLNIRNLPDEVRERLRVRAARHGRSMEAEVRAILAEACEKDEAREPPSALPEWIDRLYAGQPRPRAVDELIAERRREGERDGQ